MSAQPEATQSSDFSDLVDINGPLIVSLKRFMNQYELSRSDYKTSTNIITDDYQYKKRFYIPKAGIPQMMQHLNQCYLEGVIMHFMETQPTDEDYDVGSGLLFEFTFKTEEATVAFEDVISGFLKVLFEDILIKSLRMPKTGRDTHYCILLGSPQSEYVEALYKYKQTYRIIIPSIQVSRPVKKFIFDRIWNNPVIREMFKKKLAYSFRSAFNYNIRSIPSCFIGSCSARDKITLQLMSIQKATIEDGTTYEGISIVSNPGGFFKNIVYECSLNYEMDKCDGGIIQKRVYAPKTCVVKAIDAKADDPSNQLMVAYDAALVDIAELSVYEDVFDQFKEVLGMISDDRIAEIDNRNDIIAALASKGPKYRCIALWFCKNRCKSMTLAEFDSVWNVAVNKKDIRCDLKSLRYWAGFDSPSEMRRFLEKQVRTMLLRDVKGMISGGSIGHTNIASYLEFMFRNVFATIFIGKTITWYEFVTPSTANRGAGQLYKWREVGSHPVSLSEYISSDLAEITKKVVLELAQEINSSKDEDRKKYLTYLKKQFLLSIKGIFSTPFKRNVIEATADKFADPILIQKMDKTEHIMGVGNGVLEFDGPNVRLLDHYHSYPVSMYTETNYIEYDPENKYIKDVYKAIRSMFPDDESDAFEWVMYYLSTCVDGMPKESLFLIIQGQGCHAIDSPIMMYDGSIKMVQDIRVGDSVMGDDNTPRLVQELFRGEDQMVEIIPSKEQPFVVNINHILSLKFTNLITISRRADGNYKNAPAYRVAWFVLDGTNEPKRYSRTLKTLDAANELKELLLNNSEVIRKGDIIDIKVSDLLKWNPWWIKKSNVCLYKSAGLSFAKKNLEIDPYLFGYWLGDGHSNQPMFTTEDSEIVDEFIAKLPNFNIRKAEDKGKASSYRITDPIHPGINRFMDSLRYYDVAGDKHVPEEYITGSHDQRLELLAGIIDSDGHYQASCKQYELTLKSEKLMDGCIKVIKSLGFSCYKKQVTKVCTNSKNGPVSGTYYRIQFSGEGLEHIPSRLARKQAATRVKNKNVLLNGFSIKILGVDEYYGFELDGNHRYLTGDYIVHHNSNGKSVLVEFLRAAIGDMYAKNVAIALITDQKRTNAAAANPAIMALKNTRVVCFLESDRSEKANISTIKRLTGGDTLSGRQLFKEQENFKPNSNYLLATNYPLQIESTEYAVWRRFMIYTFKMTFKDDPNPNDKFEKEKDPDLINKVKNDKRYHEAFLSILVHYRSMLYSKYGGRILKVPHPTIKHETSVYRQQEDIYERFIMQRVFYKENKPAQPLDEFMTIFRNYYRNENGERLKIKNDEMKHIFLNSSIQKFIKSNESGMHILQNIYTVEEGSPIIPGSVLYKEYLKSIDN